MFSERITPDFKLRDLSVRSSFNALKYLDILLLLLMAALLVIGSLFIYGTGQQIGGEFINYWLRNLLWIGLGSIGFLFFALIDYRLLAKWSWLMYIAVVLLLVLVLFAGKEINNARSWLEVPILGFTIQPAELAKPVTLLFLCWLVSRTGFRINRMADLIFFGIILALPFFLITQQPDYGTALVYIPVALVIAFAGGLSWRLIAGGLVALVILCPLAYNLVLAPHQQERIKTFVTPAEDISDTGWNAYQSMLAVGSGGMYGKGFMNGTQHALGYLPQTVAPSDFIYSVIGEETGFIGSAAVICAFMGVLLCCFRGATLAKDKLGSFICLGVATLLFVHVYVNIGMTIGASPIIGIPLPFISYGGSFMICIMACMGLVENVYIRSRT